MITLYTHLDVQYYKYKTIRYHKTFMDVMITGYLIKSASTVNIFKNKNKYNKIC